MKFWLSIILVSLCGCTVISHRTYHPCGKVESRDLYLSFGTDKQIQSLDYGSLKIRKLNSNQTSGVKAVSEGVTEGAIKAFSPLK